MRTFRAAPAVVAAVLFLVAGNALIAWVLPGPHASSPEEEMWLVYFAVMSTGEPPEALGQDDLRALLGSLDPEVEQVAERVTVLSYQRNEWGFALEARHSGDGATYRVTAYGVE